MTQPDVSIHLVLPSGLRARNTPAATTAHAEAFNPEGSLKLYTPKGSGAKNYLIGNARRPAQERKA